MRTCGTHDEVNAIGLRWDEKLPENPDICAMVAALKPVLHLFASFLRHVSNDLTILLSLYPPIELLKDGSDRKLMYPVMDTVKRFVKKLYGERTARSMKKKLNDGTGTDEDVEIGAGDL